MKYGLLLSYLHVKAHLFPSPIGLKSPLSLSSSIFSPIYISLLHVSVTSEKPSRHFGVASLSLSYRSFSSLTYQHGIRARLKERSICSVASTCPADGSSPCYLPYHATARSLVRLQSFCPISVDPPCRSLIRAVLTPRVCSSALP